MLKNFNCDVSAYSEMTTKSVQSSMCSYAVILHLYYFITLAINKEYRVAQDYCPPVNQGNRMAQLEHWVR